MNQGQQQLVPTVLKGISSIVVGGLYYKILTDSVSKMTSIKNQSK